MPPYDANKNSQGFTVVEVLITVIIVGILSMIAAPSFLAIFNKNKVNNALNQVRGALQEAQREAIRKSKNCTVVIPAGNNVTLTSPSEDKGNGVLDTGEDTNGNGVLDAGEDKGNGVLNIGEDTNGNGVLDRNNCLITGNRTLTGINIRRNTILGTINFNLRGRTTLGGSDTQAIVFSLANNDSVQEKCLMISNALGIIRTGIYSDTVGGRTSVDPVNSNTNPNCEISRTKSF